MVLPGTLVSWRSSVVALVTMVCAAAAPAQSEGGLYTAGEGFSFEVAAERAMAQNPGGRRFFLLSLPPETAALGGSSGARAARRCASVSCPPTACCWCASVTSTTAGSMRPPRRAWWRCEVGRAPGSNELPDGQRYFADEDPVQAACGQRGLAPVALHLHMKPRAAGVRPSASAGLGLRDRGPSGGGGREQPFHAVVEIGREGPVAGRSRAALCASRPRRGGSAFSSTEPSRSPLTQGSSYQNACERRGKLGNGVRVHLDQVEARGCARPRSGSSSARHRVRSGRVGRCAKRGGPRRQSAAPNRSGWRRCSRD